MDYDLSLNDAMDELESAEDFLVYFDVPFDPSIVNVNRLHILQRFHDYLKRYAVELPVDESEQREVYRSWLTRAYSDFVESDALTEKVFAVFHNTAHAGGGMTTYMPLDKVMQS